MPVDDKPIRRGSRAKAGTGKPGEDEEDIMEKDLADDAVWKRIQQNTFTRWANEHLRTVNKAVTDLSTDFSDGLRLIALVEVLAGKKLPPYNKRPKMRAQKLENVNIAIQYLKNEEKIRIVNIDSIDVVDGKTKLICGVVWTLILHYSISMPMWEGEDESMYKEKGGPTPKQRLLKWIQNKVPEVPINNFTKDWNDAKAIGALVDACAPGLCPDWERWDQKDALKNATEAMKIAEQFLSVPQLVTPEELTNPKVDELSMMTYLAQFPNAKLKDNAPTRPRHNPKRVRCYGPGVQPEGVNVGAKTSFTVDTFSAGQGDVQVFLQDPSGKQTPVDVKFNNDQGKTYTCSYTAKMEGPHKVIVKFSGVEVPKSPFNVEVKGVAGDASKVKCDGPGLKPTGNKAGTPTTFSIDTSEAGPGQVEVQIIDPKGKANSVPLRVRQDENDETKYKCEYAPVLEGAHKVEVSFAGKPVPGAPFNVKISPPCNAEKVRALGRGIQPTGVRVNDIADFKVYTEGAGTGTPEVKVMGPDGQPVKCMVKKLADGVTYDCDYKPLKEGRYVVVVSFAGQEIFQSPYEVQVGPVKDSKIVAYGPGLKGGVVGHPARFTVDTNGETGTLGFSVEGPSYAKIECKDNGDGSAEVNYFPTAPGEYAVHVTCDGEDIPNSPYMPMIIPKTDYDPSKVVATGPGLAPKGVVIAQPTEFTVDTKKAGKAPLDVSVMTNADYRPVDVKVTDMKDGTYKAAYKPDKLGKHTVHVNYGGVAIPNSPFRVGVGGVPDPSKVKVSGPGVSKGVKPQQPTHYIIDTKQAGGGELITSVKDEKGKDVPVNIIDHQDGMYTAEYTAPAPGKYKVTTTYAGRPVPGSPVDLKVTPPADVSKVKVDGLEPNQFVSCINTFTVDARAVDKEGDGTVVPTITSASGKTVTPHVQNNNDGTYKVDYILPEEGDYKFDVKYDGSPIPGASPVTVKAKHGADPKRVKAYGPGLEKGYLNQPNQFTIETTNAGNGGIGLSVEGPTEAKVSCRDNRDGTCTVEYVPDEGGVYDIAIKFADENIPGSVFKVPVQSEIEPSKVTASGPGVDPENCRAAASLPFKVNAKRSAKAPLDVQVTSDKGPITQKPEIKDNNDGTYDVSYVPPPEGSKCEVKVTYGGKDIAGSPFKMKVKKKSEPKNVKISGPGIEKKITASVPQEFLVDTKGAGIGDLDIAITGPDGKAMRYWKTDFHDGTFKIRYIPEDVGQHKISVKFDGQEVPNSPVTVQSEATGDVNKCQIKGKFKEKLAPGEEYSVTVAADKAGGNGEVTCRVTRTQSKSEVSESSTERYETLPDGGTRIIKTTKKETKTATSKEVAENIDCKVKRNPDGTYSVNYKVQEPGDYIIEVKYGGQVVPNGTFTFTTVTEDSNPLLKSQEPSLVVRTSAQTKDKRVDINRNRQSFLDNLLVSPKTTLNNSVRMPSGSSAKPLIVDNHDGTISVRYDPKEEGNYELQIKYNDDHIEGSPFKFFIDSTNKGIVTAFGPGLTHGVAGEACSFTVYTKGAGAGNLQVSVEGPSKADIQCKDNKDGTIGVTYVPPAPGEFKINIKFGEKPVKGSPYSAKITGEGRKRNQLSVGHSSEVSLKVQEKDLKALNASIVAPSGLEEPCFLKKLPNGHLGISFTPRENGQHLVNVKKLGNHINGSPFKINVLDREIGDASRVRVSGKGLKEAKTQQMNELLVDTKEAGYGGLSLSIEGPSKADIQCSDSSDGALKVTYKPTEPGFYIINMKFADHHVPGSPFTVKVTGEGSNIQRENIKKERDAMPITDVGSECKLTFKIPQTSGFDMSAKVGSPSGEVDDAEIEDMDDCLYAVKFVPKEVGIHTVSVRHKDIHIPGSPFQFTVGPLSDYGSHRVHAGGPGLERGNVNTPAEFNVWTREAGAGNLSISVEGPSKAVIDFKDRKDGSCYVSYKVKEMGEYRIGIKFNDQHIPDSPYKVYIAPAVADAKKIELGAIPPEHTLQVNKPVTFTVNLNGARGQLDGRVLSPSGAEDDCFLMNIDDDQWSLRFMPRENGIHRIHVRFNGVHIPESPFPMRIGKDEAAPEAVQVHGPGLKEARIGVKTDFIIDTCAAGAGNLAVTIDGPSKASMDCTEVEEGYKVRYTPLSQGEYFITVKFNGYHVVGSPFKVRCVGTRSIADTSTVDESSSVVVETVTKHSKQKIDLPKFKSDASKVEIKGLGIKKAVLNRPNSFNVNCINAGNNFLYVGMYGPRGPCEEVAVKHAGRNAYNVSYTCKEKGEYIMVVKWGEEHIPGSPFRIECYS